MIAKLKIMSVKREWDPGEALQMVTKPIPTKSIPTIMSERGCLLTIRKGHVKLKVC